MKHGRRKGEVPLRAKRRHPDKIWQGKIDRDAAQVLIVSEPNKGCKNVEGDLDRESRNDAMELIVLYVVFKLDESYTPSKVSILAGDGFHNLKEVKDNNCEIVVRIHVISGS
ncbi:hypothetical protein JHK82_055225 [Glycine max]|nr:hypothetical protein JHK82_055225 [Glycine max]